MAEAATRAEYERWVRTWAGPVHALAYRMLRNRSDAEDATQEVFLRLWTRADLRDPSRPEGPWILRVAARVVLNRLRGETRRARREARVAPSRAAEATEVAVERREREAAVQGALAAVPARERVLLALHYYGGLPQAEIAEVLEVPRTTVASRLVRALDALRGALTRSGHHALLPLVEEVMRATPPPPVPVELAKGLLALPAASAAGTGVGLGILGGIVVTKQIVTAAALAALLAVGAGFAAGRWIAPGASGSGAGDGRADSEVARLREENLRLAEELARRGGAPSLAARTSPGASAPSRDEGASARGSRDAAPTSSGSATADAEGAAMDWSRFGRLFAERLDLIAAARASEDGKVAPADQSKLYELLLEMQRLAAQAKALAPEPFFDARVLPGYAVALFGDALEMTPERRAALEAAVRGILTERLAGRDPTSLDPVERQALRRRIGAEAIAAAAEGLPAAARLRYETAASVAREAFGGERVTVSVAWDPALPEGRVASQVVDAWRETYGFDARQDEAAHRTAERYVREAADVLRRHGLDRPDAKEDPLARGAADEEVLALQVAAEREIAGMLTSEQRAKARRAPPTLVVLRAGTSGGTVTSMGGGI